MGENNLKIDCISDTHAGHQKLQLPDGDLLIHAGDCTAGGELDEALEFLDWFQEQHYTNKILVPGNHDSIFELIPEQMEEECTKRGIILLNDSGCEIEGLKIWGSPVQPRFCDWAFNRDRGSNIKKHWALIPKDTEILITHGPPHKIRDVVTEARGLKSHVGCQDLYQKILQTRIKLHVFGHIHEAAGHAYIEGRTFINASSFPYRWKEEGQYFRVTKESARYVVLEE